MRVKPHIKIRCAAPVNLDTDISPTESSGLRLMNRKDRGAALCGLGLAKRSLTHVDPTLIEQLELSSNSSKNRPQIYIPLNCEIFGPALTCLY
jgi:hypothetical protein